MSSIIRLTRDTQCSDPRDRLYALFSLLTPRQKILAIEPDYSKSPSKIYQDFTQHYIEQQMDLNILATDLQQFSHTSPSWVPDWSKSQVTEPFGIRKASSMSKAKADFGAGGGS